MTRSIGRTYRVVRLAAAGVAVAAVAFTGACSAGQLAETSRIVAAVPGGSATVSVPDANNPTSEIIIQNATVVYNNTTGYAAGGVAPLSMRVFNQTQHPITVAPGSAETQPPTGTTKAASAGTLSWVTAASLAAAASPSPSVATSPSANPSDSASPPSSSPSSSQSASPSDTPSPAGSASSATGSGLQPITIPAGGFAIVAPTVTQYLAITGLTSAIAPGDVVNVTLNFVDMTTKQPYTATVAATVAPPTDAVSRVPVS